MRILHVGTLAFGNGGVGAYITSIISKQRDDLDSYTAVSDGKPATGCTPVLYDCRYSILKLWKRVKEIKKIVDDYSIDLVHVHTQRSGLVLAVLKLLGGKVKVIYTPHGFRHTQKKGFSRYIHLLYEYVILSQIDLMTAITDIELSELNYFSKKIIKIKSIIEVSHINTGNALREDFNIPESAKIIATVGGVNQRKNPSVFIDLACRMSDENTFFIWFGDGPLLDSCRQSSRTIKNGKLVFAGKCTKDEIYSYLKQVDMFLMTSQSEGFPLSILEAYYCNLPVVCNDFLGAKEIVLDGETGFLYNYNDIISAESLIKKVIASDEIKEKFIENSSRFLEPYIDINRFCDDYYNCYRKVMKID